MSNTADDTNTSNPAAAVPNLSDNDNNATALHLPRRIRLLLGLSTTKQPDLEAGTKPRTADSAPAATTAYQCWGYSSAATAATTTTIPAGWFYARRGGRDRGGR